MTDPVTPADTTELTPPEELPDDVRTSNPDGDVVDDPDPEGEDE